MPRGKSPLARRKKMKQSPQGKSGPVIKIKPNPPAGIEEAGRQTPPQSGGEKSLAVYRIGGTAGPIARHSRRLRSSQLSATPLAVGSVYTLIHAEGPASMSRLGVTPDTPVRLPAYAWDLRHVVLFCLTFLSPPEMHRARLLPVGAGSLLRYAAAMLPVVLGGITVAW